MGSHGQPWIVMDRSDVGRHGQPRAALGNHVQPWAAMGIQVCWVALLRTSCFGGPVEDSYGLLWATMGSHGQPWTAMNRSGQPCAAMGSPGQP